MGIISLLILAAVAGFLFFQLRSVLGQTPHDKTTYTKKSDLQKYFEKKDTKPKAEIVTLSTGHTHNLIKKSDNIDQNQITQTLNDIKSKYSAFDIKEFVEGAKKAYEMILDAFNKDLPEDVKDFISDDLYQSYRKLLDSYKEKNYSYQTIVTRIDDAVIVLAESDNHHAKIRLEINAQNISVLSDQNGNIIQGDPDHVSAVTDTWTFERSYSSSSPAWIVTSVS